MTDPSTSTVHASDTKDIIDTNDTSNAIHDVTSSTHTGLLPSLTTPTLSSRARSYGAIATPDQPSRATSAANPRQLGSYTVDAARANSTARTTSVSGSKRQLVNASSNIIPNPQYDLAAVDLETDFETDLNFDPALDADIDGSSSSSSAVSDSDADMPPQTAFLTGSQRRLAIAYAGLLLVAFTTSLEAQVTAPLAAFAVSSFQNHSLLSTVVVVQGVVNGELHPSLLSFILRPYTNRHHR